MKSVKPTFGIFIATAVLLVFLAACAPGAQTGRAVFTITDAAASMDAVSSVKVTVDDIKVHSEAEGWVTVSSAQKTYDLIELQASGKHAVLADVQLKEGTYEQVRLHISKVMVTDANGTHEAKLPSGDLKIVGNIVVAANETAAVTFDFMADESLHLTGKGEYIMAPVIQFKSRSDAEVEIEADGRARISGGENEADEKVGMDVSGKVGVGLKIDGDEELEIEGGAIKLGTSATGRAVFTATDAAANLSSVSSVKITVNSIQAHSAKGWKTVSAEEKTYDLLELKASGDKVVLADVQLSEGTYEQIRLNISKVMVKDENGTHEAKLPSGELKVVGRLSVDANKTSAVIFDFIVNESLHLTGDGQYVFAPVVRFQTFKNASVELKSGGKAEINGGKLEADEKVGMDLDGKVGAGRGIRADEDLEIEASGRIKATA